MARHGRNIKALSLKIGQKNEDFAWIGALQSLDVSSMCGHDSNRLLIGPKPNLT